MAYYPIEKLHRLYDGYQQALTVAGRSLLVIQEEGKVFIINNVCPHMDAPLTHSTIKQGVLRCPLHGLEFELPSGKALRSPIGPLVHFQPVYEGDSVGVEL